MDKWYACDKCGPSIKAYYSMDNIPFEFDGEMLPVGELFFCGHCAHKLEPIAAQRGYTLNQLEEIPNSNRLVGSEN